MIKVGLDLGIFKILARDAGPKTANEVAKETAADPVLIGEVSWILSIAFDSS